MRCFRSRRSEACGRGSESCRAAMSAARRAMVDEPTSRLLASLRRAECFSSCAGPVHWQVAVVRDSTLREHAVVRVMEMDAMQP